METIRDRVTGETYYLQRKVWDWIGEVMLLEHDMPWLQNICIRHGIAFAKQGNQEAILLAHKNHKFEFAEFVDFLRTFFPIVFNHNLTSRMDSDPHPAGRDSGRSYGALGIQTQTLPEVFL